MKRRKFFQYAGLSALSTALIGTSTLARSSQAQSTGSVTVQWLGHTCFLFSGDGRRILVNPFRTLGCTADYRTPNVVANLVMISSRLLDEGVVEGLPGNPRILSEPGVYEFSNMQVQGIATPHDLNQGRRFGTNVVWRWTQGGVNLLHLGGAAAPIMLEEQILIGRPDVVFIPVGGGVKAYNAEQARQAIDVLNPKIIVPTHYRTAAADPDSCDIAGLEEFLALMDGVPITRRSTDSISFSRASLPETGQKIEVFNYRF
ncbi:MAG: MBL fold metallo-hydrolase [Cyanobacteria bacterium P01_E01_bin.6]